MFLFPECIIFSRYGWLEIAQTLLNKRNVRMINLQNNQGKTPLHYACHEGHAQIAQLLLTEGATIERSVEVKPRFLFACVMLQQSLSI